MFTKERQTKLKEIEKKIDYEFEDITLLNRALTHSSFANEFKKKKVNNNERLEFLGDSVLSLSVSDYIFKKYPSYPEGDLTKLRATVVCEPVLASASKKLGLGNYLLLGKGEEITGGHDRASILADAFEAVIGAIYLDGGMDNAKKFILNNLSTFIEEAVKGNLFLDYKTQLQEILQKNNKERIHYEVIKEEGPDHNKTFHVEVSIGNKALGRGTGKNKKEAEQEAAKEALNKVGAMNE